MFHPVTQTDKIELNENALKVHFLINPHAGRPRDLERVSQTIDAIARRAGLEHRVVMSPTLEGIDELVENATREGVDLVCAVGGDGTVHEIGRRLIGTELALGIIPLGSGNGLARHLGIPCNVEGALKTFTTRRIETIDTGLIDSRPFLGICGIGLDADVAHRFADSKARGLRTYISEGLVAWSSSRANTYELEIDGVSSTYEAYLIAFANSGQYGNEARVAPLASLNDGLLDVSILHSASLASAPSLLYRLFTGSFHKSGAVTSLQGREVKVSQEKPSFAHIDGDPAELPATFEVTLQPASLRVLVPHDVASI